MNKSERNAGARTERYAILRKVRRMNAAWQWSPFAEALIVWLLSRDERTAKKRGGLGRGK